MAGFIKMMMDRNNLTGGDYVEPYAGGAGIAISLLSSGYANHVHINDLNSAIFAFWKSVFFHTDDLCRLIRDTPVSMKTWRQQKNIIENPGKHSHVELGFATFFLNRTNRSGILSGGVIGGKEQSGKWHMDVRYNKNSLCLKIETISSYADQVSLYQLDAEKLLAKIKAKLPKKTLFYLDPPYFVKSKRLYQDLYTAEDHTRLAKSLHKFSRPWIVSYDDVPQIRKLYTGFKSLRYRLSYSAGTKCEGAEALYFSSNLKCQRISDPLDMVNYG